jgi:pimeloyl-ACP methyl ester carboxylesterase
VPLIDGPDGPLEVRVTGSGEPVTVFAHGLAGSIDETRPFGSGVRGSRVFLHFRGHGSSYAPATLWTYDSVKAELMAVVTAYAARRALGVSLGAGAILRAAYESPESFERLVLVLPGALDRPRDDDATRRMQEMARLVESRDVDALTAALVADQPIGAQARPDVRVWAGRQARRLAGSNVARALLDLPPQHPLDPPADLSGVTCPVLVVGQEDDPAHPAGLAREIAERLPDARLRIFDGDGLVWAHRRELLELVGTFLNADPG